MRARSHRVMQQSRILPFASAAGRARLGASRMMTATTIRACSLRQMCPVVALQTHARGEIVCSSPVFTPACCHDVEAGKAASAGCGAWLPVIS